MRYSTLLIDLDETVYPSSSGVWDAIADRMNAYMHERLHMDWEGIPALRHALFEQYGTTLRGLQATRTVDIREYVDFVHDVPLDDLLQPDPVLREVLLRYPQRKIIFTNADRNHASRVLRRLGLDGCFDDTVDILDLDPYCKPMPEAFQTAMRMIGETRPDRCLFIDDSPRNTAGARALGFATVLVGRHQVNGSVGPAGDPSIERLSDLPAVLDPGGSR